MLRERHLEENCVDAFPFLQEQLAAVERIAKRI